MFVAFDLGGVGWVNFEGEYKNGVQDHFIAMHGVFGLRTGMPKCGDLREGGHLRDQSEKVYGVHRLFR